MPEVADADVWAYTRERENRKREERLVTLEVECAAPNVVIWGHTGKARG